MQNFVLSVYRIKIWTIINMNVNYFGGILLLNSGTNGAHPPSQLVIYFFVYIQGVCMKGYSEKNLFQRHSSH